MGAPVIRLGAQNPVYGNVLVRVFGSIENVDYTHPPVIELPFYHLVKLTRVMFRNTTSTPWVSKITIFNVNPSLAPVHYYNRVYYNSCLDTSKFSDDLIIPNIFHVTDGQDKIWVEIAPQNGSSQKYDFLIEGTMLSPGIKAQHDVFLP